MIGHAPHTHTMKPTHRDRFIFEKLCRYSLTAAMVADVSRVYRNARGERQPYTTLRAAQMRLKTLTDHGYLKYQPLRYFKNTRCYRLARKAAKLILSPDEYQREKRSKILFADFRPSNEEHNMAISHFMVKLEIDADRAGIEFPVFARDGDSEATVEIDGRKRKLIPDATIVLVSRGDPQLFFLEVDMSTETLKWFAEKIRKYTLFRRDYPTITLGRHACRGFRVLTVCKSRKRLENLVALADRMKKTGMFQFLTMDQFLNQDAGGSESFQDASLLHEIGFATPAGTTTLYGQI